MRNKSITDDLIRFEILKATWRMSRRIARRWRLGLRPVWLALAVAALGTVGHVLNPAAHWVPMLLALVTGGVVALAGDRVGGAVAKLAPQGLDTGEEGKLDGLAERAFVALLFTCSLLWVSVLVRVGWNGFVFQVWLAGLVLFGVTWWVNQRVRVSGKASRYAKRWYKLTQAVQAFEGSRLVGSLGAKVGSVKLLIELPKGRTGKSVFGANEEVASFYGLRGDAVQIHQAPSSARRVVVVLTPSDPWKDVIEHPMPEPGTLALADSLEFTMGMDSSGAKQRYKLQHTLIVGQSESGKSVWLESLLVYLTACRDAVLIGIDMATGATLGPWEELFALPVASDRDSAIRLMTGLLELVQVREARIAQQKRENPNAPDFFVPSEDDPWVILIIDEHPDIVAEGGQPFVTLFGRIMKRSRKAGIRVVIAAQNGSKDDIGSKEAQAQFKGVVGFPVDLHASKTLWKQLHSAGWSTSDLKQGQYKIRDNEHRTPTVYKGIYATPSQRAAHRAKALAERPRLRDEDWAAIINQAAEPEEPRSIKPEVYDMIEKVGGEITAKNLAERMSVTPKTAHAWLNKMREAGEVTNSAGKWRLVTE